MTAKLTPMQDIQIKLMRHYGPKDPDQGLNLNYYMSFDPGEGTGYATWAENGYLTGFGNVYNDVNGVSELLMGGMGFGGMGINPDAISPVPEVIIYEKWKLLKTKEFYGSTLLSSQVVGVIRAYAHLVGAELVSNETNVKTVAQKWTGLKPVGAHSTQHFVDAINHGWHYLQCEKKVTPRINWNEPGGM